MVRCAGRIIGRMRTRSMSAAASNGNQLARRSRARVAPTFGRMSVATVFVVLAECRCGEAVGGEPAMPLAPAAHRQSAGRRAKSRDTHPADSRCYHLVDRMRSLRCRGARSRLSFHELSKRAADFFAEELVGDRREMSFRREDVVIRMALCHSKHGGARVDDV